MITVEHLTKRYGDFTAVDDISFTIEDGHIYGFLGPNGAGKSTTMNIMTGCLAATSGEVKIDGYDIFEQARQAKQCIGYLPEIPPLYTDETPQEYLRFVAEAKGIAKRDIPAEVARVIRETRLTEMENRLIRNLSKGYRQRVGIAQALLGAPQLIILDEPTVGLDPAQVIEIRRLIQELGKTHTVILSSHILSEVQAVCDAIMIISRGRLVASDTPENLTALLAGASTLEMEIKATEDEARAILGKAENVADVTFSQGEGDAVHAAVTPQSGTDIRESVFNAFAKAGRPLLEMSRSRASLEDVFMELTQTEDAPQEQPAEETDEKEGEAE